MTYLEHVRNEYSAAVTAWRSYAATGPVPLHVEYRRIAAIRSLHYLEDPTTDCRCATCRIPVVRD